VSKLTKHSFLDKIKNVAKSKVADKSDSKKRPIDVEEDGGTQESKSNTPSWGALKDDYMLKPKKVRLNVGLRPFAA
jgi:hypothetical protein